MHIQPEDLQIGDEIIVPSLGTFKKLRVKRLPVKDKDGCWKACPMEIYNANLGGQWSAYDFTSHIYNDTFRFQFDRHMWLINRQTS